MATQPRDTSRRLAKVGVVIVTHESATTIRQALGALPVESLAGVVVVDNASTDPTANLVRGHRGVMLIALGENLGFGTGCNRGAAALPDSAELVLFLNPDAVIEGRDLATLVEYLEDHPRCGLVAPRLFREGAALTSAGGPASLATEIRLVAPAPVGRRLPVRRFPAAYDRTGPVGYVEGACFLARRDVLGAIGGFDERFFLFYEELDLARRLEAVGRTVDLCAEAAAEHLVAVSRASTPNGARPHLLASAERYLRKWHGLPAVATYRAAAVVTSIARRRRTDAGPDPLALLHAARSLR